MKSDIDSPKHTRSRRSAEHSSSKPIIALFISLALSQASLAVVSDAIKQLEHTDLETAKKVVKSLTIIAADKSNAESKIAESLVLAIKSTFIAEFNVQQAILEFDKDIEIADELERQGQTSMKPNAFGTVNKLGADAKFKAAREKRTKAVKRVKDGNSSLAACLNALTKESQNTELSEQDQLTLRGAVTAVENRTLKPTETLCVRMGQHAEELTEKFETKNAAQEQAIAREQGRDAALAAMSKAIKTGKARDEAYAMEMLIKHVPESVKDYTDYVAARAAARAASIEDAEDDEARRKIKDLEDRLDRIGAPW